MPSFAFVCKVVVLSGAVAAACSSDPAPAASTPDGGKPDAAPVIDSGAPDAPSIRDAAPVPDAGPDAPSDTAAPEIRSVLVATSGPFGTRYDLGARDVRAILPRETTAEVTVFARDDVTAYAELRVEVRDADGKALPVLESGFANGIWKLTVDARPGLTLSPRVVDEAGNVATSPGSLVLRSREDAVAGDWHLRFFDPATLELVTRSDSTWEDGTFVETAEATSAVRRGTFAFDGDVLTVGNSGTPDGGAVESTRSAAAFVDDTAFSTAPYERSGAGAAIDGTWVRSWKRSESEANTEEAISETLVLAADRSFTLTRTGTRTTGSTTTDVDESSSGTYRTAVNGSYTTGNVYFLGFTTATRNGAPVTGEPEDFTEYVLRGPVLMLGPRRR